MGVPEGDLTVQSSHGQLLTVRAVSDGQSWRKKKNTVSAVENLQVCPLHERMTAIFTIRGEVKRFFDLPAVQHVPQADGAIPRGAGEDGLNWTETQAADWTLVTPKDLVRR